jgi:uncharacterized protein (TIRG00374 family)
MKSYIKKNWKLLLNVSTFFLLGLAIFLLRSDIAQAFRDLGRVNAVALLLILPLQIENYAATAHLYQEFFKILGVKQPFKRMFKVGLEVNLINHIFPSGGVSGFSYFTARLKPYGVSTAQATLTQTMRFMLTFTSYLILLFTGLFMLALGGSASNMTILITCSIAFLTLFGIGGAIYVASSEIRIRTFTQGLTKLVNKALHLIRPSHPETINLKRVEKVFKETHEYYVLLKEKFPQLRRPFMYSLLASVAELATIYSVYIAYGQFVNPGAVIIAYALANVAGLVSVLPGGIGVYESLMSLVLVSAGVPAGLAISVTVMYRVLTMIPQLTYGYYLYHQAIKTIDKLPNKNNV